MAFTPPAKTIFMCPPTRFDVSYVINPWMEGNYRKVNGRLATAQWEALRAALVRAGAKVVTLAEPPEDCPDAVFTANAGLLLGRKFIPSYFKFLERAGEEGYFIQEMVARGYELAGLDVGLPRAQQSFEGAGDALYDRAKRVLWLGFGLRTELAFTPILEAALNELGVTVRPLELIDPRFYHLDTCFCPLDGGGALWYPPALSTSSQYAIKAAYPGAVAVGEADAMRFACNAVSIGSRLITPLISGALVTRLVERGLQVEQVDMSEFLRAGGACKCLTLEALAP